MCADVLKQIRATLAAIDPTALSPTLVAIWHEIQREMEAPLNTGDPLQFREALERAGAILKEVYGDHALEKARTIEALSERTFPRVVTRRLERLEREAEREGE